MMEKVIPVGSWDFGVEPTAQIKVASTGLRGYDRLQLEKRSSSDHVFSHLVDKIALHRGDVPIHAIAIGATEAWGPNRNGDGFNEETCKKQAHTFVGRPLSQYKEGEHNGARFYMNHKNKHPPTSYGYVKAAGYNPRMRRIELLLIGNGTKEAAERNGGLIMPDDVQEKLAQDKLLPFSMACKIAHDVCSICNNHAPSREHYCTKESCIGPDGFQGLGCRYGLTKLAASGRQQFVENPDAMFFDFSKVTRPADRTAYGGRAAYLEKAASATIIEGGAALAELFSRENYPSDGLLLPSSSESVVSRAMKLAAVLADLEQTLAAGPSIEDQATANAFHPLMQPPMDLRGVSGAGAMKMAEGFRAIHEAGAMLSLADFVKIAAPDAACDVVADSVASASRHLPGIYRRLLESDDLRSRLQKDAAAAAAAGQPSAAQRALAQKLAASRSCRMNDVRERVSRMGLTLSGSTGPRLRTGAHEKIASDGNGEELARRYAVQKLIFLASRPEDSELMLTAKLANLQNHVI